MERQGGPTARPRRANMHPRNLSILVGTLCLATAAGVTFWSQETFAVSVPPGVDATGPDTASEAANSDAPAEPFASRASDGVFRPSDGAAVAVAAPAERRTDTSGWTSGVVRGDIRLAVSVLDRLRSLTVIVEEARNAFDNGQFERPHRLMVPVEFDPKRATGTPTFEVRDVPFSAYPYVVTVHAPGLNGGRRTVVVDAEHPLVEDVVLTITPGAPFSVLLRDQDGGPHSGIDVAMLPVGEPLGRPAQRGTTDNFGSIVFESVLAGDYELTASDHGQPFGEPQRASVQPGNQAYTSKVQGQGHVMTIPRGVALQLNVHDGAGYGLGDATVTATATDRVRLTRLEARTDPIGRASFPHLQPGVWQVTIERSGFQRVDLQITLKADQGPESRDVKLVPTRR